MTDTYINCLSKSTSNPMSSETADYVLSGTEFNAQTQTKYAKLKINKVGGKSVGVVNSRTNTVLNISTPLMLTWGLASFSESGTAAAPSGTSASPAGPYSMSLQFPNDEYATNSTRKFLENMTAFENKIKADAIVNSKEWFGKPKLTPDAVNALWTPLLKYPKNKNPEVDEEYDYTRAPTLRIKVPFYDGMFKDVELYDLESNLIYPSPTHSGETPLDLIAKGSQVAVTMQCGGIWFANGKFGITWKLLQAIIKPKISLRGKCLIKLDPEERSKIANQPVPIDDTIAGASDNDAVQATVDTDDEDDAPAQVSLPAPAVAAAASEPAAKKKVVRKKD